MSAPDVAAAVARLAERTDPADFLDDDSEGLWLVIEDIAVVSAAAAGGAVAVPPPDATMRDLLERVHTVLQTETPHHGLAHEVDEARRAVAVPEGRPGQITDEMVERAAEAYYEKARDQIDGVDIGPWADLKPAERDTHRERIAAALAALGDSGQEPAPSSITEVREYADKQRRTMLDTLDASEGNASWAAEQGEAFGDVVRFIDSLAASEVGNKPPWASGPCPDADHYLPSEAFVAGALSTQPPFRTFHPAYCLPLARIALDAFMAYEPDDGHRYVPAGSSGADTGPGADTGTTEEADRG